MDKDFKMYAITFDLDTNCLNDNYHQEKYNNAYLEVRKFLEANHFTWQQGSTYFGNDKITAVDCVTVVQKMTVKFDSLVWRLCKGYQNVKNRRE